MIKIIIAIFCLALFGCSAGSGIKFSEKDMPKIVGDNGLVVFYRPAREVNPMGIFFEFGIDTGVFDIAANDQKIAQVGSETFATAVLPIGDYKVNTQTKVIDEAINISVNAGSIQYIKVERWGYSYWTQILLKLIEADTAKKEIKELTLQENPNKWTYTKAHSD